MTGEVAWCDTKKSSYKAAGKVWEFISKFDIVLILHGGPGLYRLKDKLKNGFVEAERAKRGLGQLYRGSFRGKQGYVS